MAGSSHHHPRLDPALRTRLVAEFRERWTRAGRPGLVQHILGNMSQAHGVPLGVLKDIARTVRAEHEQHAMPADHTAPRPVTSAAPLAIVDGSNLAWARTTDDGLPRLDNLKLVRTALAERGYQALVVVDAALRHQLGGRDASELDRQIAAQDVIQAPAETDGDVWVISIADHHAAPVVSNDRFDEYRPRFPWLSERRVAVVLVEHAALLQGDAGQWLKVRTADGEVAFGIPSQCAQKAGRHYVVTTERCDCEDFKRIGLSRGRIGEADFHDPCKHMRAVQLQDELVRAQQIRPRPRPPLLAIVVRLAEQYERIFGRD